ncbi:MAG: hypothetical protein ACI8PT_004253 [Gammaproteobacteria bacterium]|jgi:hypothetical protein
MKWLLRSIALTVATCCTLASGPIGAVEISVSASVEGEVVTATVHLTDIADLPSPTIDSLDLELHYTPSVLELLDSMPGEVFTAGGAVPVHTVGVGDGVIKVAIATFVSALPIEGGALWVARFQVRPGALSSSTNLNLTRAAINEDQPELLLSEAGLEDATVSVVQGGFSLYSPPTEGEIGCAEFLAASGADEISRFDLTEQRYVSCAPPTEVFTVRPGVGYVLRASSPQVFATAGAGGCRNLDFVAGLNLVGLPQPAPGQRCAAMLESLGASANGAAIQRFDDVSGRFESCAVDVNGNPRGTDFSLESGQGYLVYMPGPATFESPQCAAATGFELTVAKGSATADETPAPVLAVRPPALIRRSTSPPRTSAATSKRFSAHAQHRGVGDSHVPIAQRNRNISNRRWHGGSWR